MHYLKSNPTLEHLKRSIKDFTYFLLFVKKHSPQNIHILKSLGARFDDRSFSDLSPLEKAFLMEASDGHILAFVKAGSEPKEAARLAKLYHRDDLVEILNKFVAEAV